MRYIFMLFITLTFFSCKEDTVNVINNSHKIKVIDSISINYNGLTFQDYRNNKLLFFNFSNFDVITYELEKNKLEVFNKYGQGFDEYKKLLPGYVKFLGDSIIGIGAINSIKKYQLNGKFIEDINFNIDRYAPLTNIHIFSDTLVLAHLTLQGDPSKPSFYDKNQKIFITKNLLTGREKTFMDFPLVKSDFKNDNFYYNNIYNFPSFVTDTTVNFINTNGNNIYEYSIKNNKIINITPLNIDNYKPLKINFSEKVSYEQNMINLFRDSNIWSIFKTINFTYIFYSEGYSNNFMKNYVRDHKGFPYDETPPNRFYIYYFNNETKNYNKVKMIDKYSLIHVFSDDTLLFQRYASEEEEQRDITTFYFCKLE